MKPLLLFFLLFSFHVIYAQSLDYISVRKQNGSVVKNFYAGSTIILQQTNGTYLQGPVQAVRNDSIYVTVYDIRYYPTNFGTYVRDTISTSHVGIRHQEIQRILLNPRRGFFKRLAGPLLMIGGGGYMVLNVINGLAYNESITDSKNLHKLGTAAGAFGLGFLLKKLFATDGFSKPGHSIVYVDL
jgi:hypothetical protein